MTKLIRVINVTNGKQVEMRGGETLNQLNCLTTNPFLASAAVPRAAPATTITVASLSSDEDDDDEDDSDDMDEKDIQLLELDSGVSLGECPPGTSAAPKKKRQRLTHLTSEEKCMRRKLKNRVAAQSARDRKKVRMDDLEETVDDLKRANAQLKSENSLLKEKAQVLLDENRKLLKFKAMHEQQQQQTIPTTQIQIVNPVPAPVTVSLKRKLPAVEASTMSVTRRQKQRLNEQSVAAHLSQSPFEAEESAVFSTHASQQKSQLQAAFHQYKSSASLHSSALTTQQFIYALIVYTMSLIRVEDLKTGNKSFSSPQPTLRQHKLRATLLKLVKLLRTHRALAESRQSRAIKWRGERMSICSSSSTPLLNSNKPSTNNSRNACKVAIILSLTLKWLAHRKM